MMKADDYAAIHAVMEASNYGLMTKPQKKTAMDEWLSSALGAASVEPEHFSSWEKIYFREAISNTQDGLFLMAYDALYKATMPGPPAYDHHAAAAQEIDGITIDGLREAAERLSHAPAQPYAIFVR